MPMYAAARLMQQEPAQGPVLRQPARLRPQRVSRWRAYAADNHVAHFAFGVATDHIDRMFASHEAATLMMTMPDSIRNAVR